MSDAASILKGLEFDPEYECDAGHVLDIGAPCLSLAEYVVMVHHLEHSQTGKCYSALPYLCAEHANAMAAQIVDNTAPGPCGGCGAPKEIVSDVLGFIALNPNAKTLEG